MIKSSFTNDWKNGTNSYMQSSKYYSALIRYLRFILFDKKIDLKDLDQEVKNLKKELSDNLTRGSIEPIFDKGKQDIPSTKYGIAKIFGFLKNSSDDFLK